MPTQRTVMRLCISAAFVAFLYYVRGASTPQRIFRTVNSTAGLDTASGKIERRVVCVADLHGDLEHAHNVLRMANLIDSKAAWIGGHDVLVSTGDSVDRGPDTIALYEMWDRLRTEALSQGGEVHTMLGNHEIMNAIGDWRYVTKEDLATFGSQAARRKAMSTTGWIGRTWLANYSVTGLIDLLPPDKVPLSSQSSYKIPRISAVHGGITPEYARQGVQTINDIGHSFLLKGLSDPSPGAGHYPTGTNQAEADLYGENGPLWYRGYATGSEATVCPHAHEASNQLGVRHLVMGHTPHFDGFVVRCDSAILLIDTGISRAYGGEQSALIIHTDLAPTSKDSVWEETEVITALYRGRTPKVINRQKTIVTL